MQIEVPRHLKTILQLSETNSSPERVYGRVMCPCGSNSFAILYPGQTHEFQGLRYPCTANIGGNLFFLVSARCTECNRIHLLIDQDFHGFNGVVCHDLEQAKLGRPSLIEWNCRRCNSVAHSLEVSIAIGDRDDFVAETADRPELADKWFEAFEWFSVEIECLNCGHTEELVSMETA